MRRTALTAILAATLVGPLFGYNRESVGNAGAVTAPAAGAAIATVPAASLPAATYEVCIYIAYAGLAGAFNNMELRKGPTVISSLLVLPSIGIQPKSCCFPRITLNGAQALSVNATAAGAAGVVFLAQIIATEVHP